MFCSGGESPGSSQRGGVAARKIAGLSSILLPFLPTLFLNSPQYPPSTMASLLGAGYDSSDDDSTPQVQGAAPNLIVVVKRGEEDNAAVEDQQSATNPEYGEGYDVGDETVLG